jgi:hypothetical protein
VEAHAHFDRGRPQDLAAARKALEDATANGPRTTWFRRLARTVSDLEDYEQTADDTDRFLLAGTSGAVKLAPTSTVSSPRGAPCSPAATTNSAKD